MKDIIARLRELHTDWEKYEKREPHEPQPYSDQIAEALPQLLDRLEKQEIALRGIRDAVERCILTSNSVERYNASEQLALNLIKIDDALAALDGEKK